MYSARYVNILRESNEEDKEPIDLLCLQILIRLRINNGPYIPEIIRETLREKRFFALLKSDFFSGRDYLSYGAWILIEIWHASDAGQHHLRSSVELPHSFLQKFKSCSTKEFLENDSKFGFRLDSFLKQVSHAFSKLVAGLRMGIALSKDCNDHLKTELSILEKTLQSGPDRLPEDIIQPEWMLIQCRIKTLVFLSNEVTFNTDPDSIDENDNTILHLLVGTGVPKIELDAILDHPRYQKLIHYRNSFEETPVIIATAHGRLPLVQSFVNHGAIINVGDKYGQSPLYIAMVNRSYDVMRYLLDLDAEVDPEKKFGENPLHVAATIGDLEILKAVLHRGFNMNRIDFHGQTPIEVAEFYKHFDVVALLQEYA